MRYRKVVLEDLVPAKKDLQFLYAEVSTTSTGPLATVYYAIAGEPQEYGLRFDFDKRIFLDHLDDPERDAAVSSTAGEIANAIFESGSRQRTFYKYQFKIGNKIVHVGITEDLERREQEHQRKWPKGHIKQVGHRTTKKAARTWEKDKGYT